MSPADGLPEDLRAWRAAYDASGPGEAEALLARADVLMNRAAHALALPAPGPPSVDPCGRRAGEPGFGTLPGRPL